MTPLLYHRLHVAKISQRKVAAAIGVAPSTICRVETGGTDGAYRASRDLADKIAEFFKHKITRDQIMYPDDYEATGKKRHKKKTSSKR